MYQKEGFPRYRLQKFSEEDLDQGADGHNDHDMTTAIEARAVCFPCCFQTSV